MVLCDVIILRSELPNQLYKCSVDVLQNSHCITVLILKSARLSFSRACVCLTSIIIFVNPSHQCYLFLCFPPSAASPDTSVSIFSWQVKAYGERRPTTCIGVFDINCWYHAQMPDSLRYDPETSITAVS